MARFQDVGSLRPSQIVSTFGPGSIYDNLEDSLLILGTDSWDENNCKKLQEETLLLYLRNSGIRMYSRLTKFLVPISERGSDDNVPVRSFPRWGVCPTCNMLQLRNRAVGEHGIRCKSSTCLGRTGRGPSGAPETIPVRFITACINGHLDDFPWYRWVHRGKIDNCGEQDAQLYLLENPNVSSLESKIVECRNCNRRENMATALAPNGLRFVITEGCHGTRPWLKTDDNQQCVYQGNRVYPRGVYKGGTNVYFPTTVRSITIPPLSGPLADKVLDKIEGSDILEQSTDDLRKLIPVLFKGENVDEVLEILRTIKEIRSRTGRPDIRAEEYRELNLRKYPMKGVDVGDFKTEPIELPENFSEYLENLVLVRKLREVVAITGFYRITPYGSEENDDRDPSPITNYPNELPQWLPAVENRGEGIFFTLRESKIREWEEKDRKLHERLDQILRKRIKNPLVGDQIVPSTRFVLLHSLSHQLIKEISSFAGYSTSSMKERIYARDGMAGVLIYTSSPSSDGSLGGLVEQGKKPKFNMMMQKALRKSMICSMDPLCAFTKPGVGNRRNGSACHACLFLPETSCECMNDLLDRSFVRETLANRIGFFD